MHWWNQVLLIFLSSFIIIYHNKWTFLLQSLRLTYVSSRVTMYCHLSLAFIQGSTKCSEKPYALAKVGEHYVFYLFLNCKPWFIIWFIVATDVFKDFEVDFCSVEFSLISSFFTLEIFETADIIFGYTFGIFFPCRSYDWQ